MGDLRKVRKTYKGEELKQVVAGIVIFCINICTFIVVIVMLFLSFIVAYITAHIGHVSKMTIYDNSDPQFKLWLHQYVVSLSKTQYALFRSTQL